MKKIFKKSNIFSFLLGAIIFGSMAGVSAYTVLAKDIGYTPSDETWKKQDGSDITNIGDAIDELYNIANSGDISFDNLTVEEVYRKGSYMSSGTTITVTDVSNYKYYYINNVYTGSVCSSASGCDSTLSLSFTNANYVDLGISYRLGSTQVGSKGYLVFPTNGEDIVITTGGLDGIAIYGIK